MVITSKLNTTEHREINIQKRDLVKAKRVTQLSECSMSQSSKKIKDLNDKVMKYIANQ